MSGEMGTIFNIQKFSLHDGPGIRTVVFFKGCPLRCRWCANPESWRPHVQILWEKENCTGCHSCIASCGTKAVYEKQGGIFTNESLCTGCLACVSACPAEARSTRGEKKSVDEVVKICLQDQVFYEESGGGVTLSGGEALMQPEFALALIQALKARHISVAIETTGCAEREIFDRVTSEADLLLFDVKHWDEQKHWEGTGVSSRMIMENLKHAITSGRNVLPGIPVILGFNDSIEDARGFAAYLHAAGAEKVRLLPFHQFGEKKYDMLHQSYSYADVAPLHEEELEPFRLELVCLGIHAFFHNDSEA